MHTEKGCEDAKAHNLKSSTKTTAGGGGRRKSLMTIRIDPDTLNELENFAKSSGIGTTTLARQLIEEGLMSKGAAIPVERVLEALKRSIEKTRERP